MNNEITINIDEIRKSPMHSIKDAETIRQIAIYCIENPGNNDLSDKINPLYSYCGLYPYVMKSFDIKPEMHKKLCEIYKERQKQKENNIDISTISSDELVNNMYQEDEFKRLMDSIGIPRKYFNKE